MSKACSWTTLEKQLLDEVYRNNLFNCIPLNGVASTRFDDGTLIERLIESDLLNTSSHRFLKEERKNLDENGFQTLCIQHEDAYSSLKRTIFNKLPSVVSNLRPWASPSSSAIDFMNFVMDEATHLKNFPEPVDCSLVRFVIAEHDAYVPRDNVISPSEIWPGCTVDYINTGHVMALLNHLNVFRKAIKQSMDQL